ncbi:MAG: glycoside hydrolase family 3 protein [Gemmatimonadota bacterium]|nr:glycoside hydrolase family 3 protein [Gemmatimonadota bacterium]
MLSAAGMLVCVAGCARHPLPVVVGRALPRGSARWVDVELEHMTLRQKAAQMVWPSVLGDYAPADSPEWKRVRHWIIDDEVGGFTVSVGSPLEIAVKLNAMQRLAARPLLVGADLEFGAGYRARGGYFLPNGIDLGGATLFPPEMAVGATGDTALAYEQGRITAIEGRALGIHIDYAPVLDVNNNPANPVINTRSYGEDPKQVARLGASFIRGLQEHGMIATGKHFPGHGDTETNSHLALPVVNVSRARLDTVELVPFRAAVNAGVGGIMSFHGSMPALDSSGDPGTLSAKVLGGVLRGEMGFGGVIISDAMDMRGVLDRYGASEAAIRAVAAGADVLIQPENVTATIDAIVAGVAQGRLSEERLGQSVRRLLEEKVRLGLDRRRLVDLDSARALVGDSENTAAAARSAERSITLVRDSARLLPLGRLARATSVLAVTLARRADLAAGTTFDAELRRTFPALRSEFVDADGRGGELAALLRAADSAEVVVVSSYIAHAWNVSSISAPQAFAEFLRALIARRRPVVVVAMGNPYLLSQLPEAPTYLVAWGGFPVSQLAAARALVGIAPISGRLPIHIPPSSPIGAGEMRDVQLSPPPAPGKRP